MDLAVEPDKRIQPSGGGSGMEPPGFGKRLMSVLRAVFHMLRRGLCRKRLMMDLQLLLGRGKLAGKALRNLVAAAHHPHGAHHHHHLVAARAGAGTGNGAAGAASSASAADLPFAPNPRDVEFSCETTPSYSYAGPVRALFPFRIRGRGGGAARGCDGLDFAQVARALEMMSAAEAAGAGAGAGGAAGGETPPPATAAGATPSPMLALSLGRSPAGARQLRVTDSPFPLEPEGVDERANSNFDAFINKFYENLRLQAANATPDNCVRRRG
ncbi:hypothetical protein PAHAL_5G510700 [Panicum hallii]|uniref:Uncharacterized protein n=1 Tax=Panicum hallii TaxID=206008 RepID=A0A2S3HYQ9_9POAL|nr:uncharacterized protein LOC112894391 [Panicum hallii]PAN32768.1 hypothetical protein PAHAL_5G510700 [Panicum hallii]